MNSRTGIRRPGVFRRLWALCAIAPLALVGCVANRNAQTPANGPMERVAGERSDNEVAQVLQSAGLPETFAFGTRMWKGHQVHHVDRNKIASAPTNTDTPAPGTMPSGPDRSTGGANPGTNSGDAAKNMFDFMPVADLMVQGHQIYRKAGMDEALTDNIYLMATNSTGADGNADVAFVEYDAADSLMTNMDLNQNLQAANLQATISYGGKTWTAKKVQDYDPDEFDEVKRLPNDIMGHAAYQGDDDDEIYLASEVPVSMSQDTTGTTPTTGTDTATEGTTMTPGGMDKTPIFVLYEMGGNPPGPKMMK